MDAGDQQSGAENYPAPSVVEQVIRDVERNATELADRTDPARRLCIVCRLDWEGFVARPHTRQQRSKMPRPVLKRRQQRHAQLVRQVDASFRQAFARARLAGDVDLDRMRQQLSAELAPLEHVARVAKGHGELQVLLADCARLGDNSWYVAGSNGLYLISTFRE